MARKHRSFFTAAVILLIAVSGELGGEAAPLPQGPYYKVYGNYIAREGQTVSMDCLLTKQTAIVGFLSSTEWVKDGKVMAGQTSARLTLYHVTRQDAGHYQCGEPGSDLHRMGLDLHVFVVGDVLPRPDVINQYDGMAVLGRPYSLQCIIRGTTYIANEATVYTWYKDSVEVKGQTGAVLLLPNVTQADKGKYRCTAREGPAETTSPASFDFDLTVYVSPQVRIKPSGPVVWGILGENLTLTCEVTRAVPYVPKDGYSWSYLPYHEADQQILGGKGKTLTLGPLTLEDSGQYICQARNDQQFDYTKMSGHASVTVDVVYLENITLTPDLKVNEGDRVTLICGVDSHPTARLAWTVNGQEVRQVTDNLDHYVIMSAACSDSTNYTCGASNTEMPGRERNATTRVHVHCKQVPDPVATPDKALTDVTATLHFSLPQETTSSVVVLHPAGRDVISVRQDCSLHVAPAFLSRCLQPRCDLERHHLTFTLTQVTGEDQGNYTCVEEGTRRPVPDCGTQLLVKKVSVDMSQPEYQLSVASVMAGVGLLIVFTAIVIGIALGARHHERIRNFCKQLKHTMTSHRRTGDRVLLETKPESQEAQLEFDRLYEKGKVYIFPKLDSQAEETAPNPDQDTIDESKPLLSPDDVKEEKAEFKVKDLLRFTLQQFMATNKDNLPSFVFHNTRLSKQGKVILVVDRLVGVLLIVANSTTRLMSMSSLNQAVQHLVEARDKVRHRLQGLVGSCDITAVLALPCMTQAESDDVRKRVKILNPHPDIELLLGQNKASYFHRMEGLRRERASKVWRSSSQGGDDPDTVYKMAASSFLTLSGCGGPGESPHSPDPAQSWLLTPAQVEVRDSTARLLHVWGPPGSGKTTLLVYRVRQWLAEGHVMVLMVGREFDDVILAQIDREIRKSQTAEAISRLRVCRTYQKVRRAVRDLHGRYPRKETCIVIDVLRRDIDMFKRMLSAVRNKYPFNVLTTSRNNLHAIDFGLSQQAFQLGWESLQLPDCIRCTKDTVELLNLLGKDVYPPILSCSLPRDPDIPAWRVVDHCLHPDHVNTVSRCDGCKTEMSQVLPSPEQGLRWSDWIALHTGNKYIFISVEDLQKALQYFGVPACYESSAYLRVEKASTSLAPDVPGISNHGPFQERVINGVDETGRPTVHLLRTDDFRGMERSGVILVHYDERDNKPECQDPGDRETRLKEHRRQWFNAVSRSKGQVILLLLTPSPARSLLGLPESVIKQS